MTASLTGGLGRLIRDLESDVCFAEEWIHNAGVIALSAYYPKELLEAFEISHNEKICLLDSWSFPKSLSDLYRSNDKDNKSSWISKPVAVMDLAKLILK